MSGTGSPSWHVFRGRGRERFHRASPTFPSTGIITGQAVDDLSLFGIGFLPTFHFFSYYGRTQLRLGHMSRWIRMKGNTGREVKVRRSRLASPVEQTEDRDISKSLA